MAKLTQRGGKTEPTGRCGACGATVPASKLDTLHRCVSCVDQLDLFSVAELRRAKNNRRKGNDPT